MASTHPIVPEPILNSKSQSSLSRQSHSQRSSTSGRSSNTGALTSGDASAGAKPSTRGRKPFEISEEVDRGLVRVLDSTDVSFDKLAQAVEESGGPRKLWLRRRFERITDTRTFGGLRLLNHRAGADERKRRQQKAMGLTATQSSTNLDNEREDALTLPSALVPPPTMPGIAQRVTNSGEHESTLQTLPSITSQSIDEIHKRPGSLNVDHRRTDGEEQHRRRSDVRLPPEPRALIGRSRTTPNRAKRALTEDADDLFENDYGARKDRTRALSLGAIICRLEDLTGHTGLYEHIKRISVKSHLSPRFRTFRFSRGSRRASEGSTAATNSIYEQNSPTGNEAASIIYDPDPDYETFYHDPTPGRIARLESEGAAALVSLMHAKSMSMSDEDAETHLIKALPDANSTLINAVSAVDDTGVTSLHLAVAYGYPRVCRYLMLNGANAFDMTNRGSSVCRFARPAQDFAKETSLYHRILNCRQWICAGLPPPIATSSDLPKSSSQEGSRNQRPKQKRVKTNENVSTLSRVDETSTEEAASSVNHAPPRGSMISDRYSGLTPLITGFDFGMRSSVHGHSAAPSTSVYDDSPVSIRRRSCLRDHGTVLDLLTPNSFSPDVVFWPTSATAPAMTHALASSSLQPLSRPVESTSQHYDSFGGLNIYSGDFTSSTSLLDPQYATSEPVVSASNVVPEITTSFHWPSTALQHPGQMFETHPYIPNHYSMHNTTFDYQGAYQGGVSQPGMAHYPTPPIDNRPMQQQETWNTDWDLPRATAMALAEASVDYSTLWPEPPSHNDNNHSYYQDHEPNAYDRNGSTHF